MSKAKRQFVALRTKESGLKRCLLPRGFRYAISPRCVSVTLTEPSPGNLDVLDSWALVCHKMVVIDSNLPLTGLAIRISGRPDSHHLEALKRRLSYLSVIHSFDISLRSSNKPVLLYSLEELRELGRSQVILDVLDNDAVVGVDVEPSSDPLMLDANDVLDQLKAYLKGQSFGQCPAKCASKQSLMKIDQFKREVLARKETLRVNGRLALLNSEFGKNAKGINNVPMSAFVDYISEANRLLPMDTVDIMSVNNDKRLSLISFNTASVDLSAFSRSVDHLLFMAIYGQQFSSIEDIPEFILKGKTEVLTSYTVASEFHPFWDSVRDYYAEPGPFDLEFKKSVIAQTY